MVGRRSQGRGHQNIQAAISIGLLVLRMVGSERILRRVSMGDALSTIIAFLRLSLELALLLLIGMPSVPSL